MFVAGFFGSTKINFVKCDGACVESGGLCKLAGLSGCKDFIFNQNGATLDGRQCHRWVAATAFQHPGALKFNLNVELIGYLGEESFVYAGNARGDLITVATQAGRGLKAGQKFDARIDPAKALLFDANGQRVR
jgi:lactose/L-arabinose transport system ATP-binding protein